MSTEWARLVAEALGASSSRRHRHPVEIQPGLATVDGTRTVVFSTSAISETNWAAVRTQLEDDPQRLAGIAVGEAEEALLVEVAPSETEVDVECGCGALERCSHSRAAAGALLGAFEQDPWALVVWRGGLPDELVSWAESALGVDTSEPEADLTSPKRLFAAPVHPDPPDIYDHDIAPAVAFPAPPSDSGVDARQLRQAIEDAAERAQQLLDGIALAKPGSQSELVELVWRRCSGRPESERFVIIADAATRIGVDAKALASDIAAYAIAGVDGLAANRAPWDAPPDLMASECRPLGERWRTRRNRVTDVDGCFQVRLGPDHRWYGFVPHPDWGWVMVDGPRESALSAWMQLETRSP